MADTISAIDSISAGGSRLASRGSSAWRDVGANHLQIRMQLTPMIITYPVAVIYLLREDARFLSAGVEVGDCDRLQRILDRRPGACRELDREPR